MAGPDRYRPGSGRRTGGDSELSSPGEAGRALPSRACSTPLHSEVVLLPFGGWKSAQKSPFHVPENNNSF